MLHNACDCKCESYIYAHSRPLTSGFFSYPTQVTISQTAGQKHKYTMAPHADPEQAEVPEIADDTQQVESGVDAEAEDAATGTGNEVKQAQNELQDLDTDNIIGSTSEGRQTRSNKGDPLAA